MTPSLPCRAAFLAAVILGAAACDRKPPETAQATPALAQTTPEPSAAQAVPTPATPDKQGVTYGEGFHKEEAGPAATIRWVRQDAAMRVIAPAEGRYRLTFRPFTVFSTVENTIEVSANGQPAGNFSMRVFDLSNPVPATVEVPLHAGNNDLRLHSRGAENKMSETDDRMVAFGLAMPITVERMP